MTLTFRSHGELSDSASDLPLLQTAHTAAASLVKAMERMGIRAAFGVSGGAIGTIFDEICRSSIDVFLTQHEGAAAYAAMGRAIATKGLELPVCFSTAGPGMTNLLTGVASAYAETLPLLVLTGNSSSQVQYAGALQDSRAGGIDAVRMFDPITVANVSVSRAEDVVPTFLRLAAASLRHKKPVHLNVPLDVSNSVIRASEDVGIRIPRGALCEEDRQWLTQFLAARRPVVFAGNGVKLSGLAQLLAEVACRHRLPVIATTHGRGCVPEDAPCFFGTFGFASDGSGRDFLTAYAPDAILFLGTALGEMSTGGWSPLLGAPKLRLHVDIDCTKFNRAYRMSAAIDNDVRTVLEDMLRRSSVREDFPGSARTSLILPRYRANSADQGVHPGLMFKGLSDRLPSNTAVFADIGNSIAWAFRDLALHGEQTLIVALGLSAMGSAIGAAVGAATAWPERLVLCVCGDCAALMHGSELKTAAEYQLPLKIIVLNDGGPGMVHHGSRLIGLKHSDVRFSQRVNFEAYARALGVNAYSVRSGDAWNEPWLERALAEPGPVLLDVWIDPAIEPPIGDRARVLGQSESARRG